MKSHWTVYQHRHENGSMFPVQSRIIAEHKKEFDASPAEGAEELVCVQCGESSIAEKLSSSFVLTGNLARRYHHYEEGLVTKVIPKSTGVWYGWLQNNKGKEVYFAGSYGRKFIRRPGKLPVMATWAQQKIMRKIEEPIIGTRILFETKMQDNETKIYGWGYADEYDGMVSELKEVINSNSLSLPLTYNQPQHLNLNLIEPGSYRIMEQTFYQHTSSFTPPVQIWIGTDLSEINKACPLSHLVEVDIEGYNKITWFERLEYVWVACEDPRYASGTKHLSLPL